MLLINVTFGDDKDDVDILAVPNDVANNIEKITQEFFCWMSDKRHLHTYWVKNSREEDILAISTDAFVWWLNNHFIVTDELVHIVAQHTHFIAEYHTAEF